MLPIKEIAIIIILVILLIISSVLAVMSDAQMTNSDDEEAAAHTDLEISSIIGWISIAIIITATILLLIFGPELLTSAMPAVRRTPRRDRRRRQLDRQPCLIGSGGE